MTSCSYFANSSYTYRACMNDTTLSNIVFLECNGIDSESSTDWEFWTAKTQLKCSLCFVVLFVIFYGITNIYEMFVSDCFIWTINLYFSLEVLKYSRLKGYVLFLGGNWTESETHGLGFATYGLGLADFRISGLGLGLGDRGLGLATMELVHLSNYKLQRQYQSSSFPILERPSTIHRAFTILPL